MHPWRLLNVVYFKISQLNIEWSKMGERNSCFSVYVVIVLGGVNLKQASFKLKGSIKTSYHYYFLGAFSILRIELRVFTLSYMCISLTIFIYLSGPTNSTNCLGWAPIHDPPASAS